MRNYACFVYSYYPVQIRVLIVCIHFVALPIIANHWFPNIIVEVRSTHYKKTPFLGHDPLCVVGTKKRNYVRVEWARCVFDIDFVKLIFNNLYSLCIEKIYTLKNKVCYDKLTCVHFWPHYLTT